MSFDFKVLYGLDNIEVCPILDRSFMLRLDLILDYPIPSLVGYKALGKILVLESWTIPLFYHKKEHGFLW